MAIEFKYTPEEFARKVKEYHALTETKQMVFPDIDGLKNSLDVEDEEYDAMVADPRYSKTALWAKRRRASWLQRAAPTAKNTTGIKMLLTQPENGGYTEKAVDKSPRQMTVILRGMEDEDGYDNYDDDTDSDGDAAGLAAAPSAGDGEETAGSERSPGKGAGSHRGKSRKTQRKA